MKEESRADRYDRRKAGFLAENFAESYLSERGYRIIKKNYRCRYGEVDLIALKDDLLCFIEVRSKHNEVFGSPLLTVDVKKQRQIVKCALEYITRYGVNMMVRFDVLGIVLSKNGSPEYQLIEGAFESDF